jgi:hypothetical protein
MKFVRANKSGKTGTSLVFHMSKREKQWLLSTLKMYPVLDASFHQINKTKDPANKAEQQLLEDEMAAQRRSHKKKLEQFLGGEERFLQESPDNFRFTLTPEQSEWLLQILNEVRVGSWVQLGRPEMAQAPGLVSSKEKAVYFNAMEMSGYFQMALLEAFKRA